MQLIGELLDSRELQQCLEAAEREPGQNVLSYLTEFMVCATTAYTPCCLSTMLPACHVVLPQTDA